MFLFRAGLVPEPTSQVAKDRKVLGKKYDNGRVWTLRRYGQTFITTAGDYPEKCEGE